MYVSTLTQKFPRVLTVAFLALSLAAGGCAKKKEIKPDEGIEGGEVTESTIDGGGASSDSGNAMGLKTIFFPFDSFEIVGQEKDSLKNNIQVMKDNPGLKVQIEGHCDERGGIQYNLALGEKRANAILQQMAAAGVSKSRITTISMGKEKPLVDGHDEAAWAKNRRGNFVITSK